MLLQKIQSDVSEEQLAKGCSEGVEEYCKILFERFYGKMLNVCKRYAKNYDEAQDMLQEGFIRVFKNISQYQYKGSLEGWIRRVIVTTSINYCKKYRMNESIDYMEHDTLAASFSDEAATSVFTLNHAAEKIDAQRLLDMIQSLPPAYNMVFNLYAIEGYSHQEIAQMLDITEGTSRSNLAKARYKLQKMLNELSSSKKISI